MTLIDRAAGPTDDMPVPFLDLRAVHARTRPSLDDAWGAVLAHGQYVGGPEVARFEAEFAAYCGARHAVGVGNGTDALELIVRGLGIGPGDEVVVPANTFVATAEGVCAAGATPRFVDVDPDTLLLDPDAAAAAIGPSTAAIIAVHLFGAVAPMEPLAALAARHGLALVEDAAQAHGARYDGRRAGSLGRAAAFSFYPGKNLGALGDGGAVVTDDGDLAERVRGLADHGRRRGDRDHHDRVGRNSRLDTLQAALLSVRLGSLDAENAARRHVLAHYRERLPASCRPVDVDPRVEPVVHLAVVRIPDRPALIAALTAAGIGWGVHYRVPCHLQPAFAGSTGAPPRLPVAEEAAGRILSLPCSPTLGEDRVERVCDVVRSVS
ncbi:aminotransferase [Actinomycetospora sp. NBRC 106375]|uniref:DegT/DnrJ/EryC1/StrS family aminotransferase n=1 Tax=Actinomycetospora sp. NBRC 106375 TaxID=3032207 RepID=UPI0024A60272|nr:DegT/DnrJ/EryC1/StrS family aminotransferase [Actinomycetospora sp. NBRC 106375]GLZ48231.1 aminotransferase [Actinomycetospora sp. NBRC 106375]